MPLLRLVSSFGIILLSTMAIPKTSSANGRKKTGKFNSIFLTTKLGIKAKGPTIEGIIGIPEDGSFA